MSLLSHYYMHVFLPTYSCTASSVCFKMCVGQSPAEYLDSHDITFGSSDWMRDTAWPAETAEKSEPAARRFFIIYRYPSAAPTGSTDWCQRRVERFGAGNIWWHKWWAQRKRAEGRERSLKEEIDVRLYRVTSPKLTVSVYVSAESTSLPSTVKINGMLFVELRGFERSSINICWQGWG